MEREDMLPREQNHADNEAGPIALPGSGNGSVSAAQDPCATEEHARAPEIVLPVESGPVRLRLEVPEVAQGSVHLEVRTRSGRLLGRQDLVFGGQAPALPLGDSITTKPGAGSGVLAWLRAHAAALPAWLGWLAVGVYAFTRLFDLPAFPIYFFTDEAIQTMQAADLLLHHFFSPMHEFLPTFFQNGSQYNLSVSVYLQALPYLLFGKSIWVTRGASAVMTLLAAASVGLLLKNVFKSAYPWLAVLFLGITPAWFLHSRTAFETALATSFYAGFLYCYLMYRTATPRYLFAALVLGALAFYSYAPARIIILVTGLLLFLSDLKYHLQQWKVLLGGLGLGLALALPFARFLLNHPDATGWQMRLLGSYWLADISLQQKLASFALEYLHGLDPLYWYLPNTVDLPRHTMLGYGHLLRQTLPLGLLGILLALRHFRSPAHRVLLIAVLAAPSGSALVHLGITRALVMVIPMAVLTALATAAIMDWLHRRWKVSRALMSVLVFLALAGGSLYMLRDAVVNGPLWYKDYGLSGIQYGARQVFGAVGDYLDERPNAHLIVSPSWANGTDVIARFFFPDPLPFELGSPEGYFHQVLPLDDNLVFVMIPEEFAQIPQAQFSRIEVIKTLSYPDGRPGFYFVRLQYAKNAAQIIAQEEAVRLQPQTATVSLGNEILNVSYPQLDIGSISDLFDGRPDSMVRSAGINPMNLSITFPAPHPMQGIVLRVGGPATAISIKGWVEDQGDPVELTSTLPESPVVRNIELDFPELLRITRLEISVKNVNDPPEGFVHLWEITLK